MSDAILFRRKEGSLLAQIVAAKEETGKYGLCGGRGACGKCRVRFRSAAPPPSFADRRFLTPQELREGYRLACTAKPYADCEVEVCFENGPEAAVVTVSGVADGENAAAQIRDADKTDAGKKAADEAPARRAGRCFCAVDLGTTTVAMQLVDRETGEIRSTHAFQNPQRVYGIDVLSRISAAENGKAQLMRESIMAGLEDGLCRLEKAGESEEIIISGNTAMGHLLLGYPAGSLGKAPFTPYHIGSSRFDLCGRPAFFLPGISAFVGADIVSGIYACRMAEREELSLFIDLGTNGEMALGNGREILCSATAAGCAFEGGISAQVMGTDMTALTFDMLAAGLLDETGLLAEPWFTQGYRMGQAVIRQQDIRGLQMAKAAICAGVSILLDRMDAWDKIERVYLAGGFGYYLDVDKAVGIGLIPAVLQGKCISAGNTSLAGAVRYGRNGSDEEALHRITAVSRPLNLACQPEFETRYIEAMALRRM